MSNLSTAGSEATKHDGTTPATVVAIHIAAPCKLLDDVIGPGARIALRPRAGSVCRVLTTGSINVGDTVELAPSEPT